MNNKDNPPPVDIITEHEDNFEGADWQADKAEAAVHRLEENGEPMSARAQALVDEGKAEIHAAAGISEAETEQANDKLSYDADT